MISLRSNEVTVIRSGVCILLHLLWSFSLSDILQVLFWLLDFPVFGCQTTASMDKSEKLNGTIIRIYEYGKIISVNKRPRKRIGFFFQKNRVFIWERP